VSERAYPALAAAALAAIAAGLALQASDHPDAASLVWTATIVTLLVPLVWSVGATLGGGPRAAGGLDLTAREAPAFYGAFGAAVVVAAGLVLLPGVPLVPVLVLSQALNAVLLLAVLPFLRALALDQAVMGEHRLRRFGRVGTAVLLAMVAVSVLALAVLVVVG
jgi:Mn2+/Fe2+ NRAMP family transporter